MISSLLQVEKALQFEPGDFSKQRVGVVDSIYALSIFIPLFLWPPPLYCHTEHSVASHVILLPPRSATWLHHFLHFPCLSVTSPPYCSFHIIL